MSRPLCPETRVDLLSNLSREKNTNVNKNNMYKVKNKVALTVRDSTVAAMHVKFSLEKGTFLVRLH